MLTKLKINEDWRGFKKNFTIEFKPITLLVGDQGSGKSSLINLIYSHVKRQPLAKSSFVTSDKTPIRAFDFEHDNPRTLGYFRDDDSMLGQIQSKFASHGEVVKGLLETLTDVKNTCFLLDEPDMALSPRSCYELLRFISKSVFKSKNQIIAAVHNPILIEGVSEVYSVEYQCWMTGSEFLDLHSGA
jgi:predicted ATPase